MVAGSAVGNDAVPDATGPSSVGARVGAAGGASRVEGNASRPTGAADVVSAVTPTSRTITAAVPHAGQATNPERSDANSRPHAGFGQRAGYMGAPRWAWRIDCPRRANR